MSKHHHQHHHQSTTLFHTSQPSQMQTQPILNEYNVVTSQLEAQRLQRANYNNVNGSVTSCYTITKWIFIFLVVFQGIIISMNLSNYTEIFLPIIDIVARTPLQPSTALKMPSATLQHSTFFSFDLTSAPFLHHSNLGLIILLSVLYGAFITAMYAFYKQSHLQQTNTLYLQQIALLQKYYQRIAIQHQRLRTATSNISIPYPIDSLLDKDLDDWEVKQNMVAYTAQKA